MSVRPSSIVRRDISPFEISKAIMAVMWKGDYLGGTFVRQRTTFERYQRSVIGDMAKLSVKSWLEENGLEVIDWDDVRTSWRSQRKQFDLQVNGHNIEVRSSISNYRTIRETIRNENIIHPCNVRAKEITIQTFFANKRCSELLICGWTRQRHLENSNLRSPVRVGPRLVDFYFMPFSHRNARPMTSLANSLT